MGCKFGVNTLAGVNRLNPWNAPKLAIFCNIVYNLEKKVSK